MSFSIFKGDWSNWVINDELAENSAYIISKKEGLVNLPVRGWQYFGGGWKDDDTLTVTGKHISCYLSEFVSITFISRRRGNLSLDSDRIQHRTALVGFFIHFPLVLSLIIATNNWAENPKIAVIQYLNNKYQGISLLSLYNGVSTMIYWLPSFAEQQWQYDAEILRAIQTNQFSKYPLSNVVVII